MSGAELPGGWFLIFLNDVDHPFVEAEAASRLSQGALVLTCQVEEHVMASVASAYEGGRQLWNIRHEFEKGRRHLEAEGDLPPIFSDVRARLLAEQDAADAKSTPVDHVWDVPVTTVYEICGYRHDNMYLKSGELAAFTELVLA